MTVYDAREWLNNKEFFYDEEREIRCIFNGKVVEVGRSVVPDEGPVVLEMRECDPKVSFRECNKAFGRTCGNCGTTHATTDGSKVFCTHPRVMKPGQNEMNWYRKNKGGCRFWTPMERKDKKYED